MQALTFITLILTLFVLGNISIPILQDERKLLIGTRANLVQGDMILTPGQLKNGIIGDRYRWPNGIVIYQLDPAFSKLISIVARLESYLYNLYFCS